MNKFLLFISAIFFSTIVFAQASLQILDSQGNDITGSTVSYSGDTTSIISCDFKVKNISTFTVNVYVRKIEDNVIAGSSNYFCWTACYPSSTSKSPQSEIAGPGGVITKFQGDYQPLGNLGSSSVTYWFVNKNKSGDSVSVTVNYNGTALGIENSLLEKNEIGMAYPNPANVVSSVSYKLNYFSAQRAKLSLYDMLGNTVESIELLDTHGTAKISTADMPSGLYFYSLIIGDKMMATKKIIIAH